MARTPLPRYRVDITVTVELAATDDNDAETRAQILALQVRDAAAARVRNHGSRTALVLNDCLEIGPVSPV